MSIKKIIKVRIIDNVPDDGQSDINDLIGKVFNVIEYDSETGEVLINTKSKGNIKINREEYEVISTEEYTKTNILDYDKTITILNKFYQNCLKFWEKESGNYEGDEIMKLALRDVGFITTNPFSPSGETLNQDAKNDFMKEKEKLKIISKIVDRTEGMNILMFDRMSLIMDIQRVDEDMGLRLSDLLHADNFNFSHDIVGIQNNMNRETGKLNGRFLPRFKQIEKVIEK